MNTKTFSRYGLNFFFCLVLSGATFSVQAQIKEAKKQAATKASITPQMQEDLRVIYNSVKQETSGKVADYIPELAKVPADLYGIVVMDVDGQVFALGDSDYSFSIQSISKPLVFGAVMDDLGVDEVISKIGMFPTGFPFNSLTALEVRPTRLQNPMVNAGALAVTALVSGKDSQEKWQKVLTLMNNYMSHPIAMDQQVYDSEMATNNNNMAIAYRMFALGLLSGDVYDAVDRYTRACALRVTTLDLASIGATLANGGVNPTTKKEAVSPQSARHVLSAMAISGMYDNSGEWFARVGLPAKSGVGGGLIAVVPNKFAIAVFSPALDEFGNSAKGVETVKRIAQKWNLHLFDVGPK